MVNEAEIRSHKRTSKEDRGSHARIDPMECQWLAYWLQEQSDVTLAELAGRLKTDGRPAVSTPTLRAARFSILSSASFQGYSCSIHIRQLFHLACPSK